MDDTATPARVVFATGMIGLGVLGLVYGDFALQWQPVPTWVPWREGLAYVSAALMIAGGVGLLFRRAAAWSARVLLAYLVIWLLLLKVPIVVRAPSIVGTWLGLGEIAVLLAGGWVLFATLVGQRDASKWNFTRGERGVRIATILFAVSLLPIGLSHFVYAGQTAALVPAWLPARVGWAYLTGAGHIAAGLGVLFSVCPRLAASLEAGMLSVFTLFVWIPGVVAAPTNRLQWTGLLISWAITAAAWVVAARLAPHEDAARPARRSTPGFP